MMAPDVQVATETHEDPGLSRTVLTKPVLSWAAYDLANTIFSMNIVSLYLAPDQAGRRLPFLLVFVAETLGFGRPAAMGSLLVWIVISYIILRGVDDEERAWGPEDLVEAEA